jgi:hypothetical protein
LRADPFSTAVSLTAGPMVRIRFPPAAPDGTFNPVTGEPLGMFHSISMVFAGNGAVRFQLAIVDKTYNGGGVTCNDSTL